MSRALALLIALLVPLPALAQGVQHDPTSEWYRPGNGWTGAPSSASGVVDWSGATWAWRKTAPTWTRNSSAGYWWGSDQTATTDAATVEPGGLLVQPTRTQYLLNNCTAPETQAVSLGTGDFYARMEGTGSVAFAAGTATATGLPCTADADDWCPFTVTGAGTVTATVSGAVTFFQVENGPYATSKICCAGTSCQRVGDLVAWPHPYAGKGGPVCYSTLFTPEFNAAWDNSQSRYLWQAGAWNTANSAYVNPGGAGDGNIYCEVRDAANGERTYYKNPAFAPGTTHLITFCPAGADTILRVDGVTQTFSASGAGTGIIGTQPGTIYIGGRSVSNANAGGLTRQFMVCPGLRPEQCEAKLWASLGYPLGGSTIGLLGDSITLANSTDQNDLGYYHWGNSMLGHPFSAVAYAGIGGNTTTQMKARQYKDVLRLRPAWGFIDGGTNDLASGVAQATIEANLKDIVRTYIGNGVRPILASIPPSKSYDATMGAKWHALNPILASFVAATPNVIFADMGTTYLRASPDYWPLDSAVQDAVHPNAYGASLMGRAMANALSGAASGYSFLACDDTDNLLAAVAAPCMATTGGSKNTAGGGSVTGDVPAGWTVNSNGSAVTTSFLTRSGSLGKWFQMALNGAPAQEETRFNTGWVTTGLTTGTSAYVQIEYESDDDWVNAKQFQVWVMWRKVSDGSVVADTYDLQKQSWSGDGRINPRAGTLRTVPVSLSADSKALIVVQMVMDSGTVRIGRAEVRAQ